MGSRSRFAVYFDWTTGLRVGGPPGYLANLQLGLLQSGHGDSVEFVLREGSVAPASRATSRTITSRGPIFSKAAALNPIGKSHTRSDEAAKLASYHTRPDHLYISPLDMSRIEPQARSILHVHTTVDAVKAHNSLTRLGVRHRVTLALTTHSPEIPAKEWAEKAFSEGASAEASELLFYNHRETDLLAFHYSDVLIFPCKEAMEPYVETIPDFTTLFSQRDIRFLPTGAKALDLKETREETRARFGIKNNRFVASYIGRHNSVKGYDVLARVGTKYLDDHPNSVLLIGGKTGPIPSPTHERWIEAGWTDVPGDIITASDVFVLPNKQTYFDLMMVEVLSTGKVVVASNTGGNRSFAEKTPGVILYNNESELSSALESVELMSSSQRDYLGKKNKELFEGFYSCETFGHNYVRTLTDIARDRAGKAEAYASHHGKLSNNANPKVSVIVAVYNVENYLESCLRSIEAQSFRNIEILVVNDGSTDGSPQIIDEFVARDNRFKRIDRPNGGLSAARNTGLDCSSGEFVCFVDGDDLLATDMVQALLSAAEETGSKAAVCGVQMVDDEEKHLSQVTSFLFDEAIYPKWRDGQIEVTPDVVTSIFPSAWNKIYHRSVFDGVRYPPGLYYEDHPVFYRIFCGLQHFAYVNKPLYIHRERANGRITQDGSRRFVDVFAVIDSIESILKERYDPMTVRRLMVKLTLRLSWERSWVVWNPVLRFKLAEQTLMRLYRWSMSDGERKSVQDAIIEHDYVEKLEEIVRARGGLDASTKAIWPLENLISVEDSTSYKAVPPFNPIELNTSEGYVLVHPLPDSISTAVVRGIAHFGRARISFTVALEHEDSEEVEFRSMVYPFMVCNPAETLDLNSPAQQFNSGWKTLTPFEEIEITADIEEASPTMSIYLQTRSKNGRSIDYSWVRFRNFCCVDKSQ